MKTIKSVAFIFYVLVKRLIELLDAYAALFFINLGAKIFQFEYIFLRLNKIESFICMLGFRIVFGFLLLLIYDLIKRDLFEFKIKNLEKQRKLEEHNLFLEKIYSRAPWIKTFFVWIKNLFSQSLLTEKIKKIQWLQKLIFYYKNTILEKKVVRKFISLSLFVIEPIFVVIDSHDDENAYNGISDLIILRKYLTSSFLCSLALYITFSIVNKVFIF